MAKKTINKTYSIMLTIKEGVYAFPVKASSLDEALTKGKTLTDDNSLNALFAKSEVECLDETSEITGIYENES